VSNNKFICAPLHHGKRLGNDGLDPKNFPRFLYENSSGDGVAVLERRVTSSCFGQLKSSELLDKENKNSTMKRWQCDAHVVDRLSCLILADGSSAFRPLRGRLDASLSGELRSTADQFDHLPRDGRGRHRKSHRNVSFFKK
jgi:hypothetical protein